MSKYIDAYLLKKVEIPYEEFIAGLNPPPKIPQMKTDKDLVEEGKRLMMEEAVEGEITKDNRGNNVVRAGVFNKDFEYGDKVRIIIVKDEKN